MEEHELLWAILPEGLADHFKIKSFRKKKDAFEIVNQQSGFGPTGGFRYHNSQLVDTATLVTLRFKAGALNQQWEFVRRVLAIVGWILPPVVSLRGGYVHTGSTTRLIKRSV